MIMKKKVLLFVLLAFAVHTAGAQIGTHGNSDWKVPVPLFRPQLDPIYGGNLVFVVPSVPSIPFSAVSTFPSLLTASLLPGVPLMPDSPKPPTIESYQPEVSAPEPYKPYLQALPPLPLIAPFAVVRGLKQ